MGCYELTCRKLSFCFYLSFNMTFFRRVIQEWAANNVTRVQIEDSVLYGYYSEYLCFYSLNI